MGGFGIEKHPSIQPRASRSSSASRPKTLRGLNLKQLADFRDVPVQNSIVAMLPTCNLLPSGCKTNAGDVRCRLDLCDEADLMTSRGLPDGGPANGCEVVLSPCLGLKHDNIDSRINCQRSACLLGIGIDYEFQGMQCGVLSVVIKLKVSQYFRPSSSKLKRKQMCICSGLLLGVVPDTGPRMIGNCFRYSRSIHHALTASHYY